MQYTFDKEYSIKGVRVFWFDDTGFGECRVPKSWEIFYQKGDKWLPVPKPSKYTMDKNKYNEVTFDVIKTNAMRLVVQLQPNYSAGILEWKILPAE